MRWRTCGMVSLCWAGLAGYMPGQESSQPHEFIRANTWTMFAEYSNTSNPMLMGGQARQRELADFGFAYTRRIFRFKNSTLNYHMELRPVLFESDPVRTVAYTYTNPTGAPVTGLPASGTFGGTIVGACQVGSGSGLLTIGGQPNPLVYNYTITCPRQWTFGQAFSPFGFRYSMRTRYRIQPFIVGTLGYMYTNRPVPVDDAEAFNFVFDFGAGVELFRSKCKSVSLEARYHHFSNRDTAEANPGTDNVMYKLSYSFGK
jgi:hypothetical protein